MTLHRLFLPKQPSRPPPRATVADLTAYPRRAIDRICRRIRHSLVYAWPPAGLLNRPIPPPACNDDLWTLVQQYQRREGRECDGPSPDATGCRIKSSLRRRAWSVSSVCLYSVTSVQSWHDICIVPSQGSLIDQGTEPMRYLSSTFRHYPILIALVKGALVALLLLGVSLAVAPAFPLLAMVGLLWLPTD